MDDLVAECAGAVAGMIALVDDGPNGELEAFMVEPAFQSQGMGAALMTALLDNCHIRGLQKIGLDADPNAEPGFRKLGFSLSVNHLRNRSQGEHCRAWSEPYDLTPKSGLGRDCSPARWAKPTIDQPAGQRTFRRASPSGLQPFGSPAIGDLEWFPFEV